ncbi:MAG: methyltransferase domain-containing protein [Gammaproteobacteria bacterium]
MDPFYRAFEERHRGSRESIESRLEVYLPFVEPLKTLFEEPEILDLGCGRGEWLELLQNNGFQAKGIDLDDGMLLACRELNLDVCQADVLDYLQGLAEDSLSVVSAFHVVEHLPFEAQRQLVNEAYRVLKPGGLLILETPNSENLAVGTSDFYLDPTHQRPVPAKLLSFVVEYAGFARFKTLYLQEPPDLVTAKRTSLINVLYGVSPDYAIVAQKKSTTKIFSIFDEPFDRAYGMRLDILADRYDQQVEIRAAKIEARAAQAENRAMQTEARAIQAENRATQAEARAIQAEARSIEAQMVIQQMVLSSSWRITSPLRYIKGQLGRFRASIRGRTLISGLKRRINSLRYIFRKSVPFKEQNQSRLSPRADLIYADLKKIIEARKD